MNAEERLRHLLRSAGPPPAVTENDWSIFVHTAHRDRRRHRLTAMVAALLVVGVAAGTWAVDRIGDQTMPAGPVETVVLPDEVPRECPEAEPYEPASDLGAVAFVRNGDIYRTDIQGGELKLVETGNRPVDPDVQWSPDGRWISFGGGRIVRASGGAVCAPLGAVSEPTWAGPDMLVGIGAGRLLIGGPGRPRQESDLNGRFARPPVAVDGGRLVAIVATVPGASGNNTITGREIWLLDVETRDARRALSLPTNWAVVPEIAGVSPDGQWIFYWNTPRDAEPTEPRPLMAVRLGSTNVPIQVGRTPLYGDDLTWCGNQLIVTAPDKRLIKQGRQLAAARAPDWNLEPLSILAGDIWSQPVCAPTGGAVAAITYPVYPRKKDTPRIRILGLARGGSESQMQNGEYRNPSEWSSDGEWVMVELKLFDTGTTSLTLLGPGGPTRFDAPRIRLMELGPEAEELGPLSYDWYQP
jgi:hypothetical protein